ncbi:DMT family transporter [Azospirillum sp. TSO22-1]|uniref:DMT family transporter n=1 Tax=Azospirillum sp. TSO22-1 TaxID=716789 RepID=UPI000D61D2C7|nr:DMT family transporter [Azospirillum sp. TSO22-1]PWC44748.1 permease [Azospirillum sp. TSO22-1]
MNDRHARLAILAAAAVGVQVGAAIVATRFVVGQTGPASLALLRYAIGFLCLLPPVLASRRLRFDAKDVIPIALLGIIQFAVVIALLNFALQTVPSGRVALLFASFPLMTMLLAAGLGRERLGLRKSAGVALTLAGVGIVLGEKAFAAGTSPEEWLGTLAVLGSAFAGALCSVLYRPYLRKYDPLPVSAFAMLASVGFLALLAGGEGFFDGAPRITPAGWAAVVFIGVSSGVGYFLWLWALRHTTPTRVTVFLALSPVTAAALSALLLGEPVTVQLASAIAVLSAGLWLALRAPA